VIVPGKQAATIVMPRLAQQLATLRKQRDEIAAEVERRLLAHPLWPVLTSMPGVGVRTAARLLTEVAHKAFASAGHLALRLIHPWRASVQARQQGAQMRLVSICLRGLERPRLTGLLRTQGPAGKAT